MIPGVFIHLSFGSLIRHSKADNIMLLINRIIEQGGEGGEMLR